MAGRSKKQTRKRGAAEVQPALERQNKRQRPSRQVSSNHDNFSHPFHSPSNDDLEEPASRPLPVTEEDNEPSPGDEEENVDLPSMEQHVRSNIEIIEGGSISYSTSQRPSTLSRVASIPSGSDPPTGIENHTQENTKSRFLWQDVTRRPQHKATGENQSLMVLVRHVIYAEIFTGRASRQLNSVLWPDLHDELALSQLIGDVWREQRAVRVKENMRMENRSTPTELPIPAEARQLRDSVGEWRSHSMAKIRPLVAGHYQLESSSAKNADLVKQLLQDYNYICRDYRKPEKLRFFASIIIKSIAETFFGKKRYGTGLYYATKERFRPLPDAVVIISCTQIYHAIYEYSGGQRKAIKFEGDDMEAVYQNLHTAWYEQSPERRTRLLTLLLDRIQDYVGLKPEEYNPKASIPNPYKNRMDDLDELEAVGQARDEVEEAELDF